MNKNEWKEPTAVGASLISVVTFEWLWPGPFNSWVWLVVGIGYLAFGFFKCMQEAE